MTLKFKIIDTFEGFLKLENSWNELVDAGETPYAFMLHEWFKHWMVDFDRVEGLNIVVVYDGDKLVAIAPMRIVKEKLRYFPCKVLTFLSSSISPRCNFIIDDSIDADLFFEFIFNELKGWNIIITNDMDEDDPSTKKYLKYLQKNYPNRYTQNANRVSPYRVHDTDWDSCFNALSKSYRRNIKQAYRNAERLGKLEIEKFFTYEQLEPHIEKIFAVSGKSWKASDGTDLISTKEIAAFYANFSKETSDKKLWQLVAIKIDGEYIAFDYCVVYKNRITGLRSDFDETFRKIMPGHIIRSEVVKDLIAREETWEYDWGGNVTENKLGWTDQQRNHIGIAVSNNSFYGRFLIFIRILFRQIKKRFAG